jgi:hypothetical protein
MNLLKRKKFKLRDYTFTKIDDQFGGYWKIEKGSIVRKVSNPELSYSPIIMEFDGGRLVKQYPNPQSLEAYSMMILLENSIYLTE